MPTRNIAAYAATVLVFSGDPNARIDLRRAVGAEQLDALARLGLAEPFGVITAANPEGRDHQPSINTERHESLAAELSRRGVVPVPLDGCSPDLQHREASFAVRMTRDELVRLARAFAQEAIFWFDGRRFWLVGALLEMEPVPLPRDGGAGP